MDPYTLQFRQLFADLARQHKVAFVPFYLEGVAGNPALNIADGIHPNAEGAAIVEKTIWRALQPLLAEDRLGEVRLKAPASAPGASARPRQSLGEGGDTTVGR